MKAPQKRLSGSALRKIFEITNHCGKFSPRLIARRRAAKERRRASMTMLGGKGAL
jgi:hypothetical protein